MSCAGPFQLFDETTRDDLTRLDQPYALFAPFLEQVLGDVAVDRLHRIHHGEQPDLGPVPQQPFDRVLVADIQRDAVEDDVMRIQGVEHWEDIRIREDIKSVLMKEDVATMVAYPCRKPRAVLWLRLDHERIPQRGLGDFPLA